jgi:hypothetical protein
MDLNFKPPNLLTARFLHTETPSLPSIAHYHIHQGIKKKLAFASSLLEVRNVVASLNMTVTVAERLLSVAQTTQR